MEIAGAEDYNCFAQKGRWVLWERWEGDRINGEGMDMDEEGLVLVETKQN